MCSPRSTNETSPRSRGASCSCRSSSSSSTSSPISSMRKLILASLTISSTLTAQSKPRTAPLKGSLERRLATLLDQPPFDRANWGVYVVDDGKVLFARNADRLSVPASNTKLVVTAAATVLLPPDYRVTTSVYANGRVDNGVLNGDLVLYGRGDPTWSERCFAVDSLAPGACDSAFTAVDAIADSIRARGLRRVTGKPVGDGSYFDPGAVARGRPDEEGRLSRRWHGQHDRLSHLPQRAGLLRAARRVPRPPAPGHHLPDSELEPELVR